MINFKFILKKIFGNSDKEMEFFLDCQNGELTKAKLRNYLSHFCIDINTPLIGRTVSHLGYEGYTYLMFYLGSYQCDINIVSYMLENGANPNHQSKYGHTASHMVAYGRSNDKLNILKLLKNAGADFDLKNSSGVPVAGVFINGVWVKGEELDYILNNSRISKSILEQCPFPDNRDAISEAIFHSFSNSGEDLAESIKIIEILIKHGFDVNIKSTYRNESPLNFLQREIIRIGKMPAASDLEKIRLHKLKEIENLLILHGGK